MKTDILDTANKKTGEADLAPSVFEAEIKESLLHDVVLCQLASRRSGTHATKTRAFVSGGGVKPWKQKGTGRARAGSIRSPLFRGGAIIFGPSPRDYGYSLPKKVRAAALRSALSAKAAEKAITVIATVAMDAPKTKQAAAMLAALGLADKKVLLLLDTRNEAVEKSFRNIDGVKTMHAAGINVYDILNADALLMTNGALEAITERLSK
ncbi:MAG: 50S ribosomal protein L4 [Nitrospinae bacterium]|nr:50S ribosomal protein L4 [Nitrospinota bacterium]